MLGSSVVVQRKMAELEAELADVYSRPLLPIASDPRRQMSFQDVKQRFTFLKILLAAEIESQPETSNELQQIDQKLAQLEAEFDDWNKSKSCIFDNPVNTLKVCHDCTQAILQHEDEDGVVGSDSAAEKELSGQQSSSEVVLKKGDEREKGMKKRGTYRKGFDLVKKKNKRDGRERKKRKEGKHWKEFGLGMIIGALIILLLMIFSSSIEARTFLLPPT